MAERRRPQGGFTMIEILVALVVLTVGMAGILSVAQTSGSAVGFARHATEASIVGEDKLERLRLVPAANLIDGADAVDVNGVVSSTGFFRRSWQIARSGNLATILVTVGWNDDGIDHQISYRTMRGS